MKQKKYAQGSEHIIFHVDVNSAFLSWTAVKRLQDDPNAVDLRTIPSIIGGDRETRHGIVTAKSLPAKKYGIQTGEPVAKALQKYPLLEIAGSDFQTYRKFSHAFIDILRSYTPHIEQASIDEAYMDVTDLKGSYPDFPIGLAESIKNKIRDTLGFTVNVGISTNKLLAKMASDFTKPDRIHTLYPDEVEKKMWPLSVGDLFGCGKKTAQRMEAFGINTIGDAANTPVETLQAVLGEKAGAYIHRAANGLGSNALTEVREDAKSYSNEITTREDITEKNYREQLPPLLEKLCSKVSARMQKDRVYAGTIFVQIKTSDFKRRSMQTKMMDPTNDKDMLMKTAAELCEQLMNGENGVFTQEQGVRLVGVGGTDLDDGSYRQMNLLDFFAAQEQEEKDRQERERAEAQERAAEKARRIQEEKNEQEKRRREDKLQRLMNMTQSINKRYGQGAVHKGAPDKAGVDKVEADDPDWFK